MNLTETTRICDMVAALCPRQKFDEATPDAWQWVMDDVTYADAAVAVRSVYRTQGSDQQWGTRQIEPDDILREVKRVMNRRLEKYGEILPPSDLADDPRAEAAWVLDVRRRVAAGEDVPRTLRGELRGRDMSVLAGVLEGKNLRAEVAA